MLRPGSYTVGRVDAKANAGGVWGPVLSWLKRLHQLKVEHQFLGRYSVEKLHAFHQYQASARWWRVAAVLCFTPVPTLLTLVAMDIVPMNDPREGASHNAVCFVRSVISHGVMTAVSLLPMRQALRLDESGHYSLYKVALIGLLTCIGLESVWIPTAFLWQFPVPFRELLGVPVWAALVLLLHRWLTPRLFARRLRRTKLYFVVVTTQIVLFYGFLALSMAFARVPTAFQVLFMVLFPFVKIAIKRFVWHYARQLDDISTDVTVCMVEISGSLYQTVCLQFATSKAIGLVIMLTDFAQALLEVHAYLGTEYIVDGRSTLSTAFAILESSVFPGADERPSLMHFSSTASVPSQHSTGRRHSGAGSPTGPAIRRRQRRPQAGSVFIQPKLVKTNVTRRLLDLRRFDFDALDSPAHKSGEIESQTQRERDVEVENRETMYENTLANGHEEDIHVKSTTCDVDVRFDSSSSISSRSTQSPNLQVGVSCPQRTASVSSPSGTARVAFYPAKSIQTSPTQPRLSAPSSMHVVLKSVSSSAQASGSVGRIHSFAQLLRRPSATIPMPSPSYLSAKPTPRSSFIRTSSTSSKIQPVATPQSTAELPPPVLTPQHSFQSSRQSIQPSAQFQRSPSRDSYNSALPFASNSQRRSSHERRRSAAAGDASAVTIDGVRIVRKDQARILEQTLQMLFSCEVLLFVEYMEVVMPVLYSLCLSAASLLPNARYNLLTMHATSASLVSTVVSSCAYAFLELLSLLVLHYVVQRKYGISSFHLLAFILETYAMTLQGKLVGAFIVIWNTATLHQGVDFTFRFDYNALLATHTQDN